MNRNGIKDTIIAALISISIIMIFVLFVKNSNISFDLALKYIWGQIGFSLTIILTFLLRPIITKIRNNKIKNKAIQTEQLEYDERFSTIYTEIREKHEPELNKIRKKLRPITAITIFIGLVVGGIFVWMKIAEINIEKYSDFILSNATLIKVLPAIAVILFFVAYFFYVSKSSDYEIKYKDGIVADLVNKANSGLVFDKHGVEVQTKLLNSYKLAAFDNHYYNRSNTEDYIMGCLTEEHTVLMAEVNLEEVIGSRKHRRVIDVFRGLFAQIYGINEFCGTIKILNNNNVMKEKDIQTLNEVKMDSSEFEQIFNVYADDSILAMRVLTSDIMQKMVEFENRLGIHYEIVINGREMFMRFFTKSLFEPSIFNESKEQSRVRSYYEIINLIRDIVVEINKTISELDG